MITIRKADQSDVHAISAFQKAMAFETENISLDHNTVSRGAEAVILDPTKGFYLIATDVGELIACMLITFEWSDWRNGMYLWLQSLYVTPSHREKGVFRQLYQHAQNMVLESEKYIGLKLYVDHQNVIAQQAYEKLGMEKSHYRLFHWMK